MKEDNYEEALCRLYDLTGLLYGGYYEPKSDRDKELADELHQIWLKHTKDQTKENPAIEAVKSLRSRVQSFGVYTPLSFYFQALVGPF